MTNDLNPAGVEAAVAFLREKAKAHAGNHYATTASRSTIYNAVADELAAAFPTASLPQPEGETAELVERLNACLGKALASLPKSSTQTALEYRLGEAITAITSLSQRVAVVEAERDALVEELAESQRVLTEISEGYRTRLAVVEAQLAHAREAAIEECAKLIEQGFDRDVAVPYRNDGGYSKNDKCSHGRVMYEDCEACAAAAIRAMKEPK